MKSEDIKNKLMPGLIKLRRELNISQADMAEKLNLSREQYNKWENSIDFRFTDRLLEVCRILRMSHFTKQMPEQKELEEWAIKLYIKGYADGLADYQDQYGSEYYLYDYIEEKHPDIAALEISIIQNLIKSGSNIKVVNKEHHTSPEYIYTTIWKPDDFEVELKVRNEKTTHYLSFKQLDTKIYEYTLQCSRFAEYTTKDLTALLRKYNS